MRGKDIRSYMDCESEGGQTVGMDYLELFIYLKGNRCVPVFKIVKLISL